MDGRLTHIWDKTPFCVKIIKPSYFCYVIYSTKKISAYQEFGEHLVADQCQRISQIGDWDTSLDSDGFYISPGAKMGTWKCLRVQGFMIDPESIGVLKEIKLGCHDKQPWGTFFYLHNS